MRTIVDICAFVVGCLGLMMTLGSCGLMGLEPALGAPLFWLGLFLTIGALLASRAANSKTCPQCSERVKLTALKCKHCGSELTATA